MKILVTGAKGFIGKHLTAGLKRLEGVEIYEFDRDTSLECLENYCSDCEFVFHLAGVNRPFNETEYRTGNVELTLKLINTLKNCKNRCPILFSSSTHAALNTPYGISKKAAEDILLAYEKETGAKVYVYRIPNVFGSGCRPDYNSVIATFCHNIARDLPIRLNDPKTVLNLIYIDDLIKEFIRVLKGKVNKKVEDYFSVKSFSNLSLGEIADLLYIFQKAHENKVELPLPDNFIKKLHDTFISYLPEVNLNIPESIHY